jgi:hypothetical protein
LKLIAGGLNGQYLKELLLNAPSDIEWVKAAIAYAGGTPELIDFCVDRKLRMEFWGRLDPSIPISLNILERFMKLGPNYTCKLVWRYYHPKVIWFGGYGVYIGSANLTDNGWYKNIECGVFLTEADLIESGMSSEMDELFDGIDIESVPLTDEIIIRLRQLSENHESKFSDFSKAEKERDNDFEKLLEKTVARKFKGLSVVTKRSASEKFKAKFLEEWNDTLQLIRQISDQVVTDQHRPNWISRDVAKGIQVDQFLHWYYYQFVKQGNRSNHETFFIRNKAQPQTALKEVFKSWKDLADAPTSEKEMIEEHAPYLAECLNRNKILLLSKDEWVQICRKINAFWAAARQTRNIVVGLPGNAKMEISNRVNVVAEWLYGQTSENGSTVLQVLNYVLYGGPDEELSDRLWKAAFTNEWHIPQFGLSCLGEIVGWAMPDKFPPRNGRTSKALRALGFNVKVYSD